MAIVFHNGDRRLSVPWPVADEVLDLMSQLGVPEPSGEPWDASTWKGAHGRLKAAIDEGRIGLKEITQDSMGREHGEAWRVLRVGGPLPLDEENRGFLQRLLALLSP